MARGFGGGEECLGPAGVHWIQILIFCCPAIITGVPPTWRHWNVFQAIIRDVMSRNNVERDPLKASPASRINRLD
jgi:hypothetical protein